MPELTAAVPLAALATALGGSSTAKIATQNGFAVTKTTNGVFTLLPAVAYARIVAIFGYATEAFADNTGTKTLIKIGAGDNDDSIEPVFPYGSGANDRSQAPAITSPGGQNMGRLAANQPLIITVTAAVGDGTGGIDVGAITIAAITPA